jgi:transcriptional regulator GlxA family with amidase domain
MDVAILCFDDFTDIDVFLMWDLLNRVEHPGWRVRLLGDATHHTSVTGLTIPMHGHVREAVDAAAVVVTSGPGARAKLADEAYLGALRLDPGRQRVGSMCSGALLLAKLGLLAGKRATTYPTQRERLAAMGVEVVEEAFVREGNVATAAGCLAALDLAGWIIEELAGEEQRAVVLRSVQPVGRGLSFASDQRLPTRIYGAAAGR